MNNRTSRSSASLLECASRTETCLDRFAPIIATLPGASLIGDAWRDGSRTVVIVDGDEDLFIFEEARNAFVHHYVPYTQNRWVCVAPTVVAETLAFCADDDTTVASGGLDGAGLDSASWLPSLFGLSDVEVCALVAYCAADDHRDFDDAMTAADELASLADVHGVSWRAVVELVGDTSTIDFDDLDAILDVAYGANVA